MSKTLSRVILVLGVLALSVGGALGAVALGSAELPLAILTFGGGLLVPIERLEQRLSGGSE